MTAPTTAAFAGCSHCRRFLPAETLREHRGGNRRLMRYCPTCGERRTQALAALKRVPKNKTRLAPGFRP